MITGKETQKMQEFTQEQIDRAEHMGIALPVDVKEQIFEYANLIGKGNEEYQKYMEDLTDMQNHVLPYLQSFCSLEEKGVKEKREQQVAERNEGRADERVISTEANAVVKEAGKTDRKTAQQKQTVDGKDKKLSIHERLEINKKIIQEKQGKEKPERS